MAEDDSIRRTFCVVKAVSGFWVVSLFLLSIVKFHSTYGYSWPVATLVSIPAGVIYFGFAYFVLRWARRKLGSDVEQSGGDRSV